MGSQLPPASFNPPRVRVRDATATTKVVIWEQPTVAAQAVGCCGIVPFWRVAVSERREAEHKIHGDIAIPCAH